MKVNGKIVTLGQPVALQAFLLEQGYQIPRIAVEKNGEIVPKKEYEQVALTDEDTLEIITFMGGG